MEELRSNVLFGLRMIRKSPGFACVAILTLALGIGGNTAMFSFVNGVLLKPLPYPHPEEIVQVWEKPPKYDRNGISTMNFLDWKNQNTVFSAIAAETGGSFTLSGGQEPVQLRGSRVSAPYFQIFGIKPVLGRAFAPDEDQPGKDQVVILSHRIWESRFGSDPHLIGRSIILDNRPYTVIGIMPAGTRFDRSWQDIWTPLAFLPADMTRNFHWMQAWARLKPGVSFAAAQQQMNAIGERIANAYPASNKGWGVKLDRYQDRVVDPNLRSSLLVLLAAVGVVLLMGCVNLANLLLVRASAREREVAVRTAIGANSGQLLRQFLTESLLLAAFGGCLGVLIAWGALRLLKLALPPFYLPAEATVSIDFRVLLFTGALVIVTGVLFGIAPALQATRVAPGDALKEGSRSSTTSAAGRRLRGILIVTEVALAFVLLSGAGLLLRSFYQLQQVDTGFDSTNVITMWLPMDDNQYTKGDQIIEYKTQILDRVQSVPGVRNAAVTSALPMGGWGYGMPFQIVGKPIVDVSNRPGGFFKMVSASYFHTLGMRVFKGRGLSETDRQGTTPVTVINQTMADKFFKNEDPIGKRILVQQIVPAQHELGKDIPWEVVGVVADEKVGDLDDSSPGLYVPAPQSPTTGAGLVVRGVMDPDHIVKSVQRAIWHVNKNQAITDIKTLEEVKSESLGGNRLRTYLLVVFAGLALLLAAIGLFGVISYTVTQRIHELALRAALGASGFDLLQLVVQNGLALTAAGLAIGLAGSFGLTHLLASLLFQVSPRDPFSLISAALVLAAVAVAASLLPALRATRVDPMVALRYE
ncbi:MAG TPA: ABC transporter permease [Bryobacteraceae bacterium]|jgi:putative ABC transport system permease protein|nr:ABC transporter permease [Bryobacteraceae bacterium]